jgi:hypothetical protein
LINHLFHKIDVFFFPAMAAAAAPRRVTFRLSPGSFRVAIGACGARFRTTLPAAQGSSIS